VVGRASSLIAKRLLNGEHIVIVNAEKAVVVGGRSNVLQEYIAAQARGSVRKGPHFPRLPDRIFRRTVRGMLPYSHSRGREAFTRIMTYVGVPEEFAHLPKETLEGAKARPSLRPPVTLGEISRLLGGKGEW
jgi:large subunit ribosomal protein L13